VLLSKNLSGAVASWPRMHKDGRIRKPEILYSPYTETNRNVLRLRCINEDQVTNDVA